MRKTVATITFILFFLKMLAFNSEEGYGLHFHSYSTTSTERTSLFLDNDKPFTVGKDFQVSFWIKIRYEEDFGNVILMRNSDNRLLRLAFIAKDDDRVPAIIYKDHIFALDETTVKNEWIPVSLYINRQENLLGLSFNGRDSVWMAPLQDFSRIQVGFGKCWEYFDVAPIDLKDIEIESDGKIIRSWKLKWHNNEVCLDEVAGKVARTENAYWLIDNHIEWRKLFSSNIKGRMNIAFNERDALFYLVYPDRIEILDANTGKQESIPVEGGYPAMEYPGHLIYDTLSNTLISYSIHQNLVSRFSFNEHNWTLQERNEGQPYFHNHARVFNPADSSFYFFGGYGFYQYSNELYRLRLHTNEIEKVNYNPQILPRFYSAIAAVGDELYIFGGRGNKIGRQELNTTFFNDLYRIDLKTGECHTLWNNEGEEEKNNMDIMATSMYFDSLDSTFYAVNFINGGVLWKLSMDKPGWETVSRPIYNNTVYQESDFGFYSAPAHNKLFLVIDKILGDSSHDVSLYSINLPLMTESDIKWENQNYNRRIYILLGCFLLISGIFLIYKKRPLKKITVGNKYTATGINTTGAEAEPVIIDPFFDKSRSAISLLGCFHVRDKDGNDITLKFTPRLKSLLILLIIYTEKNEQGISINKATELLWTDKDEASARNNRNVSLRKLRLFLESIGDIDVVVTGGFLRIVLGKNVFCDYHTALDCMERFKQIGFSKEDELFHKALEVLFYGPLLPNTFYPWLDEFKGAYSSLSIDLLEFLLQSEYNQRNYEMVFRIADIMFLHDSLNEKALATKCLILFEQGKKGVAKVVYDHFCKEYREALGENFPYSLSDLPKILKN